MPVYLVHCDDVERAAAHLGEAAELFVLRDGLAFADTQLSRSQLYHQVKWSQEEAGGVLVARLVEPPKFSRLAPGAGSWVGERFEAELR